MLNPAAVVAASPAPDHSESRANVGTTLKLRLSLLITAVLAMVTVAGGIYVVHKARDDAREEARSTVTLTSHLLDAQIQSLRSQWESHGYSPPQFNLSQLQDIRHLSIKFYEAGGRLVDSNVDPTREKPSMPNWFAEWVRRASPISGSQIRHITWDGIDEGRVVVGPDPSYETEEMWEICSGLLELLLCFFVLVNAMVWWEQYIALLHFVQYVLLIAHVVAGSFAGGPFHVGGGLSAQSGPHRRPCGRHVPRR